ncbi:MAG: FadR/GntR family transcriptional regulator [Clostridium sp.]|jgi:GntR family transcriptional repressor for pyruvate dehydrogenase complex
MGKINANKMILEDLKKKIASGEYALGAQLPNERELASYYSVSRIPVREALKVLADQGIVEVRRGVGTFVCSNAGVVENGEKSERFLDVDHVLLETIQVRRCLEMAAAGKAAKNATTEEIDELENSLIDTIREIRKLKLGSENNFFESDARFHRLVARFSHDPVFEDCINASPEIIAAHQYWSLRMTTPMDEVISYHSAIFENILLHNEQGASEAMGAHLKRVETLLLRKGMDEVLEEVQAPKIWYTT